MLKDIKGTILKDARKDGETVLHKAEGELEAELAAVKREGEAKVELASQEAKALTENEKRERLSWAKLEGKRVTAEAKEDAVNEVLDALMDKLEAYSGTKQYADKMKSGIAAAVKELGGKAVVHVKKGDRKLVPIPGTDVKEDASIIGGAIVESKDGKLRIDLSLEEAFSMRRDDLRKDLYARMFGEGKKKAAGKPAESK